MTQPSVAKKLLVGVMGGLALVGIVEGVLAVAGVSTVLEKEDPFRGFSGLVSVFERDGDVYRTARFEGPITFNDQSFLIEKPEGGLRFFCLGGSSSWGYPWGAQAAFPAVLGDVLAQGDPSRTVEAVNVSGISYAMHRLRKVAREVLEYEPDMLVIYSGHNEFVEPAFFEALRERGAGVNQAQLLLSRSRIYSVLRGARERAPEGEGTANQRFDMTVERMESVKYDDTEKSEIVAEYGTGLREILRLAGERDVKVVLCTVPANLREWAPNASQAAELDDAARSAWLSSLDAGKRALAAGDHETARAELGSAIEMAPGYAEAHFLYAQACDALERWDEARDAYVAACDLDASPIRRLEAINDTIREIASEADPDAVLLVDPDRDFTERSPNGLVGFNLIEDYVHPTRDGHVRIAWLVGEALARAGWIEPWVEAGAWSRAAFDEVAAARAEEGEARNASWFFNQGYLLAHQGKLEEAIEKYREAIALAPDHTTALSNLASALFRRGEFDEALRHLDQLFTFAPDHLDGRVIQANILVRLGRDTEALANYRRATEIAPEDELVHLSLANQLVRMERPTEAMESFGRVLELVPGHTEARLGIADLRLRLEGPDVALELLRGIVRDDPGSARAHRDLGDVLMKTRRGDEALPSLQAAVSLDPEDVQSLTNLAFCLAPQGRMPEALDHLKRVTEIRPDWPPGFNNLGAVQMQAQRPDQAVASFQEAIRLDPRYAKAHMSLGLALVQQGQTARGEQHLRRAVELDPNDRQAEAVLRQVQEGR